jgi:hypothetical protein
MDRMAQENKATLPGFFLNLLIISVILITLSVTVILFNNSAQSAPIFLFFLVAGVAIMAGRGLSQGALFGLLWVSLSIATKQFIGAWSQNNLLFNIMESFLMAATYVAIGQYHDRLKTHFHEYDDAKQKLKLLDLEDISVGLIKPSIGLLRVQEESERAMRFGRPMSLVLILTVPAPSNGSANSQIAAMRSIATAVKSATRTLDIPFLVNEEKIALILTDTEINGANKVINNIQRRLIESRIIIQDGRSEPLQQHARIRSGYGVFLGHSRKPFDIMQAAERSLQRNIETNVGDVFQNLFIDWEPIGDSPASLAIHPEKANGILDSADQGIPAIDIKPPQPEQLEN